MSILIIKKNNVQMPVPSIPSNTCKAPVNKKQTSNDRRTLFEGGGGGGGAMSLLFEVYISGRTAIYIQWAHTFDTTSNLLKTPQYITTVTLFSAATSYDGHHNNMVMHNGPL